MLAFLQIEGTPFEIGHALGRFGASVMQHYARTSPAWASVMRWRGHPSVQAMAELVRVRHPGPWRELQGLAAGLELPEEEVFLWNCRGDLWAMAPDGCTTLQCPGAVPLVAHNEDGDPAFSGHCAIVQARDAGGSRFASFVYPGSLPGHTYAVTDKGLVITVNNLRTLETEPGVPRMVLARSLLDAPSVDAAVAMLRAAPRAGGFHLTLAQAGRTDITSVEFSDALVSVQTVPQCALHANHMIHAAMTNRPQIVTGSSGYRQLRGDELIRQHAAQGRTPDPLELLSDRGHPRFPIYRDAPDDSDDENTMTTAVFRVGAESVDWSVHVDGSRESLFTMRDTART
jgi:hypothetical protein